MKPVEGEGRLGDQEAVGLVHHAALEVVDLDRSLASQSLRRPEDRVATVGRQRPKGEPLPPEPRLAAPRIPERDPLAPVDRQDRPIWGEVSDAGHRPQRAALEALRAQLPELGRRLGRDEHQRPGGEGVETSDLLRATEPALSGVKNGGHGGAVGGEGEALGLGRAGR